MLLLIPLNEESIARLQDNQAHAAALLRARPRPGSRVGDAAARRGAPPDARAAARRGRRGRRSSTAAAPSTAPSSKRPCARPRRCASSSGCQRSPAPAVRVRVVLAVLKGDSMDAAVRDATMMGAESIHPVLTAHTDVKPSFARRPETLARWRRVAMASVKQCRRATLAGDRRRRRTSLIGCRPRPQARCG